MRAVVVHEFGEPEVLGLEQLPEPTPVPGEVLVRIQAAGVNPFETYVRAGTYSDLPALPYTPGADGAGVRTDTGERVYVTGSLSGTYAEYALCREEDVRPLPDALSYAQGAALGTPYTTAYRALFQRARATAGERVLVHGASGGVGLAVVQLALAAGLEVTGTAGSQAGSELVAAQGAVRVLDHHDPGHLTAAVELTGGDGYDLIVEFLANANLGADLKALAPRGRVIVVGSRGPVEVDARDLMNAEGAILGMRLPNARAEEVEAARAAVDTGLHSGVLRPVVGRELPLAEAARAHRLLMERPALGRLVLVP
ncbi:MAG TPA: NADPH:quinone reductase [Thermoleophilia bacterium]|nr:MAG: Quinone oxidoreductase 1 [Actinobacteria bacterium ADurb.BinA094]HOU29228.1 NADPH:quinone reductase [Thermoleophilia bacterium]HQF52798.1 NADPH:quinone reductase [Thermoleophilia bacterium]HQJ26593.1 NADPH:quinone reductase [Thermoleophilia bacterium]